jgi:formylglycine-generating enzyme required for sulfatase activity
MPDLDDNLSAQLKQFQDLYDQGLLSEDNFRTALRGLGISPDQIQRYIERQIIVHGDYLDQRKTAEPPISSPTLDADTALSRYLEFIVGSNHLLQLQGIRSSTGLVSIELEKIYITLTATVRRTITDEQQWLAQMQHLAPGEAQRTLIMRDHSHEGVQQVNVKVQEALRAHKRLVVLGDPGSGKTTLLKYMAMTFARDPKCETGLVEERLQVKEVRLPILLPLRDFAKHLQENYKDPSTDGPLLLLNYLNVYFRNQDIQLPERFFADRLQQGECLVLLDGVDEVADLPMRHRIARIIERFTIAYPNNRYVVTSRIVGYVDAARLGENYAVTTVRDFTWEDITTFVTYWNRSIEIALAEGETPQALFAAKQQTEALLKAIEGNERVRELAVNPLMLTVIALVQRYRAKLPERRAELYEEAIEVLLSHWDAAKGLSSGMMVNGRELDTGDRRSLLEPVALWMMEHHAREIEAEELKKQLGRRFLQMMTWRDVVKVVEMFLQLTNERSGLVTERGQGVYAFSHLTFQEHLAARAVSDKSDYVQYSLKRLGDSWWREVVLLEAGYLSMQGKQRVTALIQAIMDCTEEPEPYHNLVLAAECLRDVGQARVTRDLYGEVQRRLRKEFETPLRQPEQEKKRGKQTAQIDLPTLIRRRAAAAEALGRIESGAGAQPAFWRLPYGEPTWVDVAAGEFWMGDDNREHEKPLHKLFLDAFKIARVPITNMQYRFFVEATGYKTPRHWLDVKIPRGEESHPVVNVGWDDVLKYCEWLSTVTGKIIMLPSEAEWEKTARGARDQRAYPWGNYWDPTKCNADELVLGNTTPVGIFPEGASPFNGLDMAGNVWEWTRSAWGIWNDQKSKFDFLFKYPYDPQDGRESLENKVGIARVVRGGSFFGNREDARCASRNRLRKLPDNLGRYFGFRVVTLFV